MPEDAHWPAEQVGQRGPEVASGVAHFRQQRLRHAEQFEQFVVPLAGADIEQRGARRIGGIGHVHLAAGEVPEQIRVDRAEGELAGFRGRARAAHVVEEPGDLGCREVGVEQQAGALAHQFLMSGARQRRAGFMRAAILPDDRIVDRLAGLAVPDDRGFALVGDADRRDILGRDAGARHRGARGRDRRGPDPLRIMLDPAGLRKDLRKFELREADRRQRRVEQKCARRGRPLIDRQQMGRHKASRKKLFSRRAAGARFHEPCQCCLGLRPHAQAELGAPP